MSGMTDSAPYVIKDALLEAGFTLDEIHELSKHKRLLRRLYRMFEDRKKRTEKSVTIPKSVE